MIKHEHVSLIDFSLRAVRFGPFEFRGMRLVLMILGPAPGEWVTSLGVCGAVAPTAEMPPMPSSKAPTPASASLMRRITWFMSSDGNPTDLEDHGGAPACQMRSKTAR